MGYHRKEKFMFTAICKTTYFITLVHCILKVKKPSFQKSPFVITSPTKSAGFFFTGKLLCKGKRNFCLLTQPANQRTDVNIEPAFVHSV